jgi:exodeoxyribonuclease-1
LSSSETLYWHDYETFGSDPGRDRPAQFAGQRTDLDLNPIGEPLVIYARPAPDYLPQPEACLITGITPQQAAQRGVCEAEFMARIHAELAAPGTCGVGYNSLRFDDEVTRYSLYRNLYDPYAREFRNGCSRWDLIDALRTAYALRPEGIAWPRRDDGLPSFRLEDLSAANGLAHGQAHDALSDVQATIALARLLRDRQPRLYDHLFRHRGKQAVAAMIDLKARQPLLHVSGMFGAARANLGLVLPLAWHPGNRNELFCADLSADPSPLLELPAEALRERLYTRGEDLAEGEVRPGLKSVHINRCPVLLPAKMADAAIAARAGLDGARCRAHLARLREHLAKHPDRLAAKLRALALSATPPRRADVERRLYDGFLSDADRAQLERLRRLPPEELAAAGAVFEDERLPELLFRYRARNYPQTLTNEEQAAWEAQRFQRITEPEDTDVADLAAYQADLEARLAEPDLGDRERVILEDLQAWGDSLLA